MATSPARTRLGRASCAAALVLGVLTLSPFADAATTVTATPPGATWAPGLQPPPLPAAANGANLAKTPPMGWNNWAHYGCAPNDPVAGDEGLNEALFHKVADNLTSSGLAAKGYKTVTVDDCWMTNTRDANGNLTTDAAKFPSGMTALGTYFHNKGLKYGIYNDAGFLTCGLRAGSAGHFQQDANLFAGFGVDYIKMDGCNVSVPAGKTKLQAYEDAYAEMAQAIANTGRPMAHSASEPAYFSIGVPDKRDWYSSLAHSQSIGQTWREGDDIYMWTPSDPTGYGLGFMKTNYQYNWPLARYSQPNSWNDPDFLLTGDKSLTVEQQKTQMALWSIMAAPLIVSSNADALLDSTTQSILGNTSIIAIDQDPLGAAASVTSRSSTQDTLARPLANGDRAIALYNRTQSAQTLSTTLAQAGYTTASSCTYTVKDLWSGTTQTVNATTAINASVAGDGTAIYRVSSPLGCGTTSPSSRVVGPITNNGRCVTVADSNPGTPALPATCDGTPGQRLALYGDGTIRNGSSCLASTGGDGTAVKLAACNGTTAQQWTSNASGNLINASNNKCLDVYGGVDGTSLDNWPCGNAQANQVFKLPVSQATGQIHTLTTVLTPDTQDDYLEKGTCLTALNGGTTAGTKIVSSACNGSASQNWTAPGDGTLRQAGLCLDNTASGGAGTQQQLWTCSGNSNQKWTYNTFGNLTNGLNQLCLGVTGASITNGTAVELETCGYNEPGQLWSLPQ